MSQTITATRQVSNAWRAVAIVFAMAFPTLGTWLYFDVFADSEAMRAAFVLTKLLQFSLPVAWVVLVERQSLQLPGLSRAGLTSGLVFGGGVFVALLVTYFTLFRDSAILAGAPEVLATKLHSAGITTPARYLALAVFYSLAHSLLEEYYWRWFVFRHAAKVMAVVPAIVLSSLAFTSHHVLLVGAFLDQLWATALFSAGVAMGGAFWAWLYHRSGSIYGPWLSHALVDAGLMVLGYEMLW